MSINISGMHCSSCAALIINDLSELRGVKIVDVNAETGKGRITFNEKYVSPGDIIEVIMGLGYGVNDEQ